MHCYVSLPGGLCSKTKTHPGIKKDTIFKPIGHERQRRGLGEYLGQPGGMGCMLMQGLQGGWVDPRFLILGGCFLLGDDDEILWLLGYTNFFMEICFIG